MKLTLFETQTVTEALTQFIENCDDFALEDDPALSKKVEAAQKILDQLELTMEGVLNA